MDIDSLVLRAKGGDISAKEELISRLSPIRLSLCKKFYSLDREDLNQDLILVLLDCLDSFDGSSSSFQWYVRERSRYFCLDRIKERSDISIFSEFEEGFSYIDVLEDKFSMEDFFLEMEFNDVIRKGIISLSPNERFVIFFYFFRDMKLSDISKKMNVSVSTVSKLKKKGLRNLRRFLSDYK